MRYPKIRELRILHDFKQDFVAAKLGISQPEYSRLENGHRQARIDDLRKLSQLYQISLTALMLKDDNHLEYGALVAAREMQKDLIPAARIQAMLEHQEQLIRHLLQKQEDQEEEFRKLVKALQELKQEVPQRRYRRNAKHPR